jgi:hypothetical protein
VSHGIGSGNLISVIVALAGLAVAATLWVFAGRTTRSSEDSEPRRRPEVTV